MVHGTESCGVNFVSESANTCVRERVTHSQPVHTPSISDKRSKSGKAGQWDSSIHLVYIPPNFSITRSVTRVCTHTTDDVSVY